jgi:predicted O-linked N-acetylglucosamine transferase (SPINDLY family)
MLGIAAGQRGQAQAAVELLSQAIALNPHHAPTYADRGIALHSLGRLEDALASLDQALALQPDYAQALHCRGVVVQDLQRREATLAARPDDAEALNRRGITLRNLQRLQDALASFDQALDLRPDYADALNNRAITLQDLGRLEEALLSYDRALAITPGSADLHYNRGIALQRLNAHDDALASFDQALAISPNHVDALCNRGNVLTSLKRFGQALTSYEQALRIRPNHPDLFGTWLITKMMVCDWIGLDTAFHDLAAGIEAARRITPPLVTMATPLSLRLQRQCAELYAQDRFPPHSDLPCTDPLPHGERLRLAYFSADFHRHPVAYLTAGLFEAHDRTRFELIAFSFGPPARGPMRTRLAAAFDRFIDVREKSAAEIAILARSLGIDIAVDLMGYTVNCRTEIFARRAAPVQVNYLGYPGTMGTSYIDYIIADATVIPAEHATHYSEKIARLPHSFQANDSKREVATTVAARPAAGLPAHGFVFCNFNHSYKINPDDFAIWMRLVSSVEGSVLWLAGSNADAEYNLRKEAEARRVSPERLIFKKRTALFSDHLAELQLADLFLDSCWFNAHTTASDALWAGVPLLTRLGETYASRVAASLLRAIGLPELVTDTREAYADLALELARSPERLGTIRERLARNRLTQPLFDTALFARHIEGAYTAMWQRHQAGLPPEHITVPLAAEDVGSVDHGHQRPY